MKAKVTKITKMSQKDSYGNTSFIVEFDNGDKGFYTSKDEDQKKFVVGSEAEYLIEEKQGTKGKYYKVTLPQSGANFKSGGAGKAPIDPKVQMISFAMAYTKDLVVAGKVPLDQLEIQFGKLYNVMISKL